MNYLPGEWVYNQNPNTFNSMNSFILRGDAPMKMEIIFASLMAPSLDETDAHYGLLAKAVRHDRVKKYYEFVMHEDATFHDGSKLTAEDVVFSLETLKREGHPMLAASLAQIKDVKALNPHIVSVQMTHNAPRDTIFSVVTAPILSKEYYAKVKFSDVSLQPPLGSGPFKVGRFAQGRFIEYDRVDDWWGWKLPVMRGQFNWKKMRIEFYRDHDVAFEAFKSGQYYMREEFSSRLWATAYDFPAIKSGAVKQLLLPDARASGMQGFFINMRRNKLKDPRVRQALALAFDFEWSNKNLFYGSYRRTQSPFQNSPMMASGMPSPEELAILEPFRGRVPDEVFGDAVVQPISDGTGSDRKLMRKALRLLNEAGIKVKPEGAILPTGDRFTLEFLNDNPSFEKIMLPYLRNLRGLGIDARLRTVDPAQYQIRMNDYDFDMVSRRYAMSQTPGEDLRRVFSSKDAKTSGTYNLSGVQHPVVDALIDKIINAPDRHVLHMTCRALDRVLRALHFWVPQWYKTDHFLAYWDIYDRPSHKPRYSRGIAETWWIDGARAKAIGKGL